MAAEEAAAVKSESRKPRGRGRPPVAEVTTQVLQPPYRDLPLSVLQIRIRMFLDILVPDPLVRGTDPDPYIIKQNDKKNIDFNCFCDFFFYFLSLKNDVNVPSKSKKQKNCLKKLLVFCWRLEGQ